MKLYVMNGTFLFFALVFLTTANAQQNTVVRASKWLVMQKLLFKQSSASWSLTSAEMKQLKSLQETSPFANCTKVNTVSCGFSVLPVTSLVLKGQRNNFDKVFLQWETRAEYNSKGFVLERQSFGNTNTFDSIYYVGGAGTSYSKSEYQYLDLNNYPGSSFYRVKQVDRDGYYTYSNIIKIDGIQGEFAVTVVPNPARSKNVRFHFIIPASNQTIDFTISNALGIPLFKKEKFVANSGYFEIKNKTFPPGYYFINVHTQKGVYTTSFVIVD